MKVQVSSVYLLMFIFAPAQAQDELDTLVLTNISIWDGSSGEVRNDQNILIVDGELIEVGPQEPRVPSNTLIMDGSDHFALGAITPGRIANFVVFDANPQEDISVLARADMHMQLVVKDGQVLESNYEVVRPPDPDVDDPDHMPLSVIKANNGRASIEIGGIVSVDGLDLVQDEASKQQVGDLTAFRGAGLTAARFVILGHLGQEYAVNYYMDWGYNGFDEGV